MIIGNCPVCGAEMRVGTDMTNADRIRSLTDVELAGWLDYISDTYYLPDGTENWLDWLRQKVEEGE